MSEFEQDQTVSADTSAPASAGTEGDVATPPSPSPSIRDSLMAAMRGDGDADTPSRDDRARDDQGRFVAKTGEARREAATADKEPAAPQGAKPADASTGSKPVDAGAGPPATWSADKKAGWNDLASLQQAVIKREDEFTKGIGEYQNRQREFEQVIAPRRQHYASQGVSDIKAIDNMWLWFEALSKNWDATLPELARIFGRDINQAGMGQPQAASNGSHDPALMGELSSLRTVVNSIVSETSAARERRAANDLASFASEKTADGVLRRPHFEKVKREMGYLLQRRLQEDPNLDVTAEVLDDLYDRAVWSDRDIRTEQLKAVEVRSQAGALARPKPVAEARRAAVSPRGSSPAGAGDRPKPERSIRDSLKAAMGSA